MMKEMMKRLMMDSDSGDEMSEQEQMAKMEVLKELLEMAMSKSGMDVADSMQKLTVAAPDKEGMLEGLDKAEDMMEEMPEGMSEDEYEEDVEEGEEMSEEYTDEEEDEDEMYKKKRMRDSSKDY